MSSHYLASVIVPTFNRQGLLEKTLVALSRSDCRPEDYEVIVVDDGSSDDTFSVARQFGAAGNFKYVYQPDEGFRAARARNLGAALAEGEVCIFIDCGVLVDPACIRAHIESQKRHPGSVVVGYVYGFDNTDQLSDVLLSVIDPSDVRASVQRMSGREELMDLREGCYRSCDSNIDRLPAPWAIAWTCNISVPRRVFAEVGGFDEAYRSWGAEDLDFALALFRQGRHFLLNRQAVGIHYPHEKSFDRNAQSSRINKMYLHEKYNLPETKVLIDTQAVDLNAKLLAMRQSL